MQLYFGLSWCVSLRRLLCHYAGIGRDLGQSFLPVRCFGGILLRCKGLHDTLLFAALDILGQSNHIKVWYTYRPFSSRKFVAKDDLELPLVPIGEPIPIVRSDQRVVRKMPLLQCTDRE